MAQAMVSSGSVLRPQAYVSKHFSCVNLLDSLAQFGQFSYEKILLWICSISSNVTTNGSACRLISQPGEQPDRCSTKPVDSLGRVLLTRTLQIQALLFLSNLVACLTPEHATNLFKAVV